MAYMLKNINDAVDGKFLVTKSFPKQAEAGTIVHIMDARKLKNGGYQLDYRVTSTGQNYLIEFKQLKDFYAWARPDTFIARNYNSFSKKDIMHYVKVTSRTFQSFCVPLIVVAVIIAWVLAIVLFKGNAGMMILFGMLFSVAASAIVIVIYRKQKSGVKMKMYGMIQSKLGVKFK
jgi:hypothetical protein